MRPHSRSPTCPAPGCAALGRRVSILTHGGRALLQVVDTRKVVATMKGRRLDTPNPAASHAGSILEVRPCPRAVRAAGMRSARHMGRCSAQFRERRGV